MWKRRKISRRSPKLEISASLVKELRDKTGVGVMDCKKALKECNGDINQAIDYLRKKGISTAKKRGGRVTSEGQVQSYIHAGGKIGVLVEVNCETDFTGKTEDFSDFVKNVAMQIAATNPISIDREGILIDKIVEGKLKKFYAEACLLEQDYVKNPDITVQDLLHEMMAKTGENIAVKRFVRFQLGESDER
jgi:elongation factor Ts